MAIKISVNSTLRFVPESERGEKKPATLLMRPLTLDQEESLVDSVRAATKKGEGDHRLVNKTIREQVTGWENFVGEKGDLPFPEDGLTDELLVAIDMTVRAEAFSFLMSQSTGRSEEDVEK